MNELTASVTETRDGSFYSSNVSLYLNNDSVHSVTFVFFTLSEQGMFLFKKKILEQINIFFSNLVHIMYNSRFFIFRKIFSLHSNSSCQWKEVFFQNVSCHKAEAHRTQRKIDITEMPFLSGKSFVEMLKSMLSISLLL